MPWSTRDTMSLREEFVHLARQEGANRRALCRRFGISAQTGYKWLGRYEADGAQGLQDRSRRPLTSPQQTDPRREEAVVALRRQHPAWGARKISRRLQDLGQPALAPSTVTAILHRHALVTPEASEAARPWQRFEHEAPNALWQIDFKGHIQTPAGPCSPLTLLDDHSRYSLAIQACARTGSSVVQPLLERAMRRYGLPQRINADNGAPWGTPRQPEGSLSDLAVWLIRLGIRLSHSAPYHPQTNGKLERFHRSLKAEVLAGRSFSDPAQVQQAVDRWRHIYNHQRPHDALGLHTPASRYAASPVAFPSRLPAIEYGPDDSVVQVGWNGLIVFRNRRIKVSSALHRLPVALRPTGDGHFDVLFCHHRLTHLDLNTPAFL